MTGSAQHHLAKWLSSTLNRVLQQFSVNCVPDSFTFVKEVNNFTFSPSSVFLCSFNISSLFTNASLAETIQICADSLYNDFLSLMGKLMQNVSFVNHFVNTVMYQGRIQGGMWGMHPPPSAIFKHVFDEYNFSIISNLFDNNKPYALSTRKGKCTNKMHHIWCNTQN